MLAARTPAADAGVFAARQLDEVGDFAASELRDNGDDTAAGRVLAAVQREVDDELAALEADVGVNDASVVVQARGRATHRGRLLGELLVGSLPADDA